MMNVTTFYSEITKKDSVVIRQLLTTRHLYDDFLFSLHISSDIFPNPKKCLFLKLMDSKIISYFDNSDKDMHGILFFKALITSMLVMKKNIQIYSEKYRFSANNLAESILFFLNSSLKSDAVQKELADKIIKSGKHQCRIYFKHTRKNYALFYAPVVTIEKDKNPGNYLSHERYICEIEYLLKKQSTGNSQKYIQAAINDYALYRIRAIPAWHDLTLEKLNALRKTYSKLRIFFLNGTWNDGKIPDYCRENFLDCFQLIYDYVGFYTPNELLDIAYLDLDNAYLLYSYISVIFRHKPICLNESTMPLVYKHTYDYFFAQCSNALNKIFLYMLNNPSDNWKSPIDTCISLFSKLIHGISDYLGEKNYDTPFPIDLSAKQSLSLDECIAYNILWNNMMPVPQDEFTKMLILRANRVDSTFGLLQLSFELIGIYVGQNSDIYNKILKLIRDSESEISSKIIVNHILKMIYKERYYAKIDAYYNETSILNSTEKIALNLNGQKEVLETFYSRLCQYSPIVIGQYNSKSKKRSNDKNSEINDKAEEPPYTLIYQFIYRNYFRLGKPDIFPNSASYNHAITKQFLKRHHLKLVDPIRADDCPWLQKALTNMEKNPAAYKKYMNFKTYYEL